MASLVQAAVLLVYAELLGVHRVLDVRVVPEGLPAVDDGVPGGAPHGEGVADDGPLRLVVEGHDLAQVVDEARQLEPLLVRVLLADALGRLPGEGGSEILPSSSQHKSTMPT